MRREKDVTLVYDLLLRLERRVHLDELLAMIRLPRWRILVALRSRPDLFVELAGQSWQASSRNS